MASLADEIALLTNPAPAYHDPEDIDDDTRARVASHGVDDVDDDVIPTTTTKLRRRAAVLLADEDSRYAGKRVSRKRLQDEGTISTSVPDKDSAEDDSGDEEEEIGDDEDDEEEEDGDSEDGSEEADDGESEEEEEDGGEDELADFKKKLNIQSKGENKTKAEFSFEDDGDFSKYADDSEDDDGSGAEDDDDDDESGDGEKKDDESDEEDSEDMDEGDDEGISKFSKTKVDEEVKKGEATKTQLTLWDQLLKARIELQKVLVLVNQLPQPESWDHFVRAGGTDYSAALAEGQAAVKALLDKIFHLQLRLLLQHPDTKTLEEDPKKKPSQPAKAPVDDDEEIPSDSDVEEEGDEAATPTKNLKRKHRLNEYPELLTKRHKALTPYRNDTIQKWFDKTRVATGKLNKGFSAFEQSALKQIRQILSDRDRLVKRTQLKRSPYRVLGTPEVRTDTNQEQDDAELPDDQPKPESRDRLKVYDEEIFDDDDFYHQLLRELIERKSANTNDPVALSRQWLELQKLRSKVKRKVDTRASKGRKIRYDILPKLVNFMAPNDMSPWTDEARDELYSSLFGKRNPELQVH